MYNRVTVSLCNTSQIYGFDIDTTGFKSTCPTHALIEGYKVDNEEGVVSRVHVLVYIAYGLTGGVIVDYISQ